MDLRRRPLAGDEIRACWEAGQTVMMASPSGPQPVARIDTGGVHPGPREFVEVDGTAAQGAHRVRARTDTRESSDTDGPPARGAPVGRDVGWSLWGDPEA